MNETVRKANPETPTHDKCLQLKAASANKAHDQDFLWKQIRFLTGKVFADAEDETAKVAAAIASIQNSLNHEREKARRGSALYNSNRHITLNRVMQKLNSLQVNARETSRSR